VRAGKRPVRNLTDPTFQGLGRANLAGHPDHQ